MEVCIPSISLQQSVISYFGLISVGMTVLAGIFQMLANRQLMKPTSTVHDVQLQVKLGTP